MCGIVAVLRRPAGRPSPEPAWLGGELQAAWAVVASHDGPAPDPDRLELAATHVEAVDRALRGSPGVAALLGRPRLAEDLDERVGALGRVLAEVEADLDAGRFQLPAGEVERLNAAILRLKDGLWAVRVDRLGTARAVAELAGPDPGPAAVDGYLSLQVALSGLGRLEVRGRDSAGVHVLVDGHGLDLADPSLRRLLGHRLDDRLFTSMAARTPSGRLSLVYKVAAEIGELGDNVAALRKAIAADELLARALQAESARAVVLAHTRWASVGIISPANAHPLNGEEDGSDGQEGRPYVVAALNGDVDNHAQLRAAEGLAIPAEITTDAKVIPVLVSRRMAAGAPPLESFRRTVATFDGSVAIAGQAATAPDLLLLAQRGSGQGLYVGLADDAFVVASEPYGVVEETTTYLRLDGESTGGQVVALHADRAGSVEGIERWAYDGRALPVEATELRRAEITTRDIDRAGYPHFLLKEISESPTSVRKTLRGRIAERDGLLAVTLGDEALPPVVRSRLAEGGVRRIFVIGQGTAAVAAQAVAASISTALAGQPVVVSALPATELSGFWLDDDMSDTLVVAVSQSGTTTDTNRTVDLVRARRASVVAIVNRRNSDLAARADGVLYTSDGRDVEMSVASTKAFYAQVAAGILLARAVADAAGCGRRRATHDLLAALRDLPDAMARVLARSDAVARAAQAEVPSRRHWAVVGSGTNRIAAAEVRIKLSELCYKSIACDATEDKKHIDLSSEPMILVCAAGLSGANADDVAKEVAIYRAHKAAPVVIANEGEERFTAALHTIPVPPVHPELGFVLSAMAGHLFGYHAALAIDAQARPLREARASLEEAAAVADPATDGLLDRLAQALAGPARTFFGGLHSGEYNGQLEASTAVRLASLLRYATGLLPLEAYEVEYGRTASPGALLDDLSQALTRGIDELARPIDAIKHQAKTVTVGISRSEDALLRVPLVSTVLGTAPVRDRLSYKVLRTLAALDPAVAEVSGYTRYRVEGNVADKATIHVVDRGGVAEGIPSRTDRDPTLRGTKRGALDEREVTVAVGRSDGRTVVLVPETKGQQATGLTLLHVRFHDRLPADVARQVLAGYRQRRYEALVDAVTETESEFREDVLGDLSVVDLLVTPVLELAERWRP
jgi:glucosamine--fructose-6-phosphate aminotransferase (isomerizing)